MGSITLGEIAIGIVILAAAGSFLFWLFRPGSAARPGLPEITPEAIDTGIDNLANIARRFAQAAEHRKKLGLLTPEQRRAWVIERLKMYVPIVPSHLWELALDAALGEIDEAKEVMRVQPAAAEPSSVSEFEVDETGRLRLVSVRAGEDMLIRARTDGDDPLGLGWQIAPGDTSYPDHRGERPPGNVRRQRRSGSTDGPQ